jgi:hypothetical protein
VAAEPFLREALAASGDPGTAFGFNRDRDSASRSSDPVMSLLPFRSVAIHGPRDVSSGRRNTEYDNAAKILSSSDQDRGILSARDYRKIEIKSICACDGSPMSLASLNGG